MANLDFIGSVDTSIDPLVFHHFAHNWRSLSRLEQANALLNQFPQGEQAIRFRSQAEYRGLLTQWEADERQAGHCFSDAREWIQWSEATKGERSGQRCEVWVNNQPRPVLYTQTREYHMTGGEKTIEVGAKVWGAEYVRPVRGHIEPYREDVRRAAVLRDVVALVRAQEAVGASTSRSTSKGILPDGQYIPEVRGIRVPGVHPTAMPDMRRSPRFRIPTPNSQENVVEEWSGRHHAWAGAAMLATPTSIMTPADPDTATTSRALSALDNLDDMSALQDALPCIVTEDDINELQLFDSDVRFYNWLLRD